MASRSPLADPCRFVRNVADGCAHVLEPVLGFLERVAPTHRRDPVLLVPVVWLALLALIAYLLLAIVVFVVSVAADGYCRIVDRSDVTPELTEQAAAALSPAALLGWLVNLATKLALAVAFLVFSFVVYMICNVMLAARN